MKARAHAAVSKAIREGRLRAPEACEACGAEQEIVGEGRAQTQRVVYHHHDYSAPLDVIPLCRSCHVRVHDGAVSEPRTGRRYPTGRGPGLGAAEDGVGARIAAHRTAHSLSLEAMGTLVGVSRESIRKWEAGTTAPNPRQLAALFGVLECTPEERRLFVAELFDVPPGDVPGLVGS